YGWTASAAVDAARAKVAALIGAAASEIVFTSGATEANNLALKGIAGAYASRGTHIVTAATEHSAVLDPCRWLETAGFRVTRVAPATDGTLDPDAVAAAVTGDTLLVSIMLVNNEIGTIAPIAAIASAVKAKNPRTLVHTDAAQGAGKIAFDVREAGVDLASLSAHKIYGPKGVGALWVKRRPRIRIEPLVHGGGHERGMRAGTLPVPLVVGFGKAAELSLAEMADESAHIARLRDRLQAALQSGLDGVFVNGTQKARVAGNLNMSFAGVDGEALILALRDIAVSAGAACASAARAPSHVLAAIGVAPELAQATLRFGLGRTTTEAEIDTAAARVIEAVTALRAARMLHTG
ncbi:MAG TPA: aminotransferase class V-fold PLP-dependent enzyme, partial [Kofleriaceae bacterium]|nr:aminotransferase class V-fold PLP-dependent enzyme [Kofleriaceae bacterium]